MGIFNEVYCKCPHCGEQNSEQFKPGYMQSWKWESDDIPYDYLVALKDHTWHCHKCREIFTTKVDIEIKIENKRVK